MPACRHPSRLGASRSRFGRAHPRPRIQFEQADLVWIRVLNRAKELNVRGARSHVLGAVLKLLCGWSRISDDEIRIAQIVDEITGGGGRAYDPKTVGRALSSLAAEGLIVYRPACGRGACALIEIGTQFVEGIQILERDCSGSVTFSARRPSYTNDLLPQGSVRNSASAGHTPRPTEVNVNPETITHVMANLPAPFDDLPHHLRRLLRAEVRQRLRAGWAPDHLLHALAAPCPNTVHRPYRLALHRFARHFARVGPRLAHAQHIWDNAQRAARTAAHQQHITSWYGRLVEATDHDQRRDILHAWTARFGRRSPDPVMSLAAAARQADRKFPDMPLGAALARWVQCTRVAVAKAQPHNPVQTAALPPDAGLLADLVISAGHECSVCGLPRGRPRTELPLRSIVCDHCWPVIAAQLNEDPNDLIAGPRRPCSAAPEPVHIVRRQRRAGISQ